MTVWVDEVFALNLLIDWLLLKTATVLTGRRRPWWRLGLAALLGAGYAVAVLLPALRPLGTFLGRMAVFGGMCAIAFGLDRRALKQSLWFLGVCCGFFGLSYAVSVLTGRGVLLLGGAAWYAVSFRFLALLAGVSYLAVWLLLPKLGQHGGGELVQLVLHLGGRSAAVTALRDTGNTLRDPLSGKPVLVADLRTAKKLLPELPLSPALLQDPASAMQLAAALCPQVRTRLIPYCAVGTERALLLAIGCTVTTEKRKQEREILVALSPTPVSDGGLYEALTGGI